MADYNSALTDYDPFARYDDDPEEKRRQAELRAARREHEGWSLAQSKVPHLDRGNEAAWIKPPK